MASVARTDLSKSEKDELCCVYSALVLHDSGADITADSLQKIITASGNTVEKYWPALFARSLKGLDLAGVLGSVGTGSAGSAPAPSSAPQETKKEEEKPAETKKDDDDDALAGGIGFGDDEW
ncbi:hypothetical protein SteCoe_12305 [Stentor coeruleus]|uniref:60S acidic ribosomal protein P1 n=1 Tax=Stentor coeruleus TaxID=5963 RepID=A0A1R2CB96_9CILI|nr:hypothetical protein SteCoe_12305 [Stentor coeruleus]